MKLLVDIGNTRIKWAYDDGAELLDSGSISHRGDASRAVREFVAGLHTAPTQAFRRKCRRAGTRRRC